MTRSKRIYGGGRRVHFCGAALALSAAISACSSADEAAKRQRLSEAHAMEERELALALSHIEAANAKPLVPIGDEADDFMRIHYQERLQSEQDQFWAVIRVTDAIQIDGELVVAGEAGDWTTAPAIVRMTGVRREDIEAVRRDYGVLLCVGEAEAVVSEMNYFKASSSGAESGIDVDLDRAPMGIRMKCVASMALISNDLSDIESRVSAGTLP